MKIDISQAVPGMIVSSDIEYDASILISRGNVLTARYIERLRKFGINSIDVVTDKIEKTSASIGNAIDNQLFDDMRSSLKENNYVKLDSSAQSLVSSVLNTITFTGDFSSLTYDLRTFDNTDDTLNHSIRVAIYSIALAYLYDENLRNRNYDSKALEKRLIDLKEIAIAALLCDRGQNCNGDNVLEKIRALKEKEDLTTRMPGLLDVPLDQYDNRYVSLYSYCLASDIPQISSHSKYMILFSSENENGTGPLRPNGFDVEKVNSTVMASKMIHLCSLYDNMLAHCLYTGESFENIVGVLGQAANHGVINKDLSNLFLSNVPICPVGTKVILSNGKKAEIVKNFVGYTYATRPIVRVLSTNEIIDLRREHSITIGRIYVDEVSISDVIDSQMSEMDRKARK